MRHAPAWLAVVLIGACGSTAGRAEAPEHARAADEPHRCDHEGSGHSRMGTHGGMRHGGMGHGMRHGAMGHGMRHGGMGRHERRGDPADASAHRGPTADQRDDFHALLDAHSSIEREVELTDDGAITRTTSDDPAVTLVLRRHVAAMKDHLSAGGRVRQWDPLFAALADRADEIEMTIDPIPGGLEVRTRGSTPEAIALIHAHAEVVSAFVAHGRPEAHREHAAP